MKTKRTALTLAMITALGLGNDAKALHDIYFDSVASFQGVFTMVSPSGSALMNTSLPYVADPTWGYGLRTPISGSFTFDPYSGAGTATINPFEFFNGGLATAHNVNLQMIGDGFGNLGTLVAGSMLFDWNSTNNISVGIVFDAAGFFAALLASDGSSAIVSGEGAIPASNVTTNKPSSAPAIGPAPMATTTWNTDYNVNPGCVLTNTCLTSNDTLGGDPMNSGPFPGNSANFDFTTIDYYLNCNGGLEDPPPGEESESCDEVRGGLLSFAYAPTAVPIPAAVWLFGSGLLGLLGVAQRKPLR